MTEPANAIVLKRGGFVEVRTYWRGRCVSTWIARLEDWPCDD